MNKLVKYLNRPYPVTAKAWKNILAVALLVFLILYLFQPFGIVHIKSGKKIWALMGYSGVTAVAMLIQYYLLPALLPSYHNEKHWTVGRHILANVIVLLIIASLNIIYGYIFHITWQHINLSVFLSALLIVVIVGIFPITIITTLQYNRFLKTSLRDARQINVSLSANSGNTAAATQSIQPLRLAGTGKDTLEIAACQLLYMEAYGNYVKVHYLRNGATVHKTLRATVRQMEEAVAEYPFIVRCHRAFLVNLHLVAQASGNSQGYRLTLSGCEDEVPVSRAFTASVKHKIEQQTV